MQEKVLDRGEREKARPGMLLCAPLGLKGPREKVQTTSRQWYAVHAGMIRRDNIPVGTVGFTRIGEEERRDGEAIALHKTHIWANSLKPVCFLCFLLFWCPLLPFIETGTLKIYTKMVLYMKNEIFDLKYPLHGV